MNIDNNNLAENNSDLNAIGQSSRISILGHNLPRQLVYILLLATILILTMAFVGVDAIIMGWQIAPNLGFNSISFLIISFLGLFVALLLGIYLGRKASVKPVIAVEHKAETLTHFNEELNANNKLLVQREIELEESNKKLQELDEIKSEFVSIVAHQFRTPLAGIKWTLDLLINGDVGTLSTDQKGLVLKVIDSNERMIRFVNDLLSFSRIESGRLEYSFVPVNLQHVVESVLLDVYPLANRKQITINFRSKGVTLPSVLADTEKIRAAFQNLIENAVKYTPTNGHITLELRNRVNDVLASVKDDGIGIAKEEQAKIFNRFYRAPSAVKSETDGSGLGLYLVKAIVEGHGGRVWFESEAGKGSTFFFTIPVPRKDDSHLV